MAFEPDWVSRPGETLLDLMLENRISLDEAKTVLGIPIEQFLSLLMGHEPISIELARKLEIVTKVPAQFWLNRQEQYDKGLVRIEGLKEDGKRYRKLKKQPIYNMIDLDKALDLLEDE